jgi:penicillin-binding protein 1C
VTLPSAVTAWLAGRHRAVPEAPVFDDDCAADVAGAPPVMVTPGEGQIVTLIPGVPAERQRVPLSASTHAAALTWFVDGERIGSAAANDRVYWAPATGTHEIVVADDAGRKARRSVMVELAASQRPH